jgi:hypothetical protein
MGRAERSVGHQRSKTVGIPFVAVITLGILLFARGVESAAETRVLVTVAYFGDWTMVMLLLDLRWSLPKTVCVVARTDRVVFTPPWAVLLTLTLAMGTVLVSLAWLWLTPEKWTYLPLYPRAMIVLGPLMGLVMIAEALWRLRRPAGLTLSKRGLSGVRAGPQLDLDWAALGSASVFEGGKRRMLVLTSADGRGAVAIPSSLVGGDAYAVATVINYYSRYPEERRRLSDGLDAVRHVDDEVGSGRFDHV